MTNFNLAMMKSNRGTGASCWEKGRAARGGQVVPKHPGTESSCRPNNTGVMRLRKHLPLVNSSQQSIQPPDICEVKGDSK